jgi:hypothetical protein
MPVKKGGEGEHFAPILLVGAAFVWFMAVLDNDRVNTIQNTKENVKDMVKSHLVKKGYNEKAIDNTFKEYPRIFSSLYNRKAPKYKIIKEGIKDGNVDKFIEETTEALEKQGLEPKWQELQLNDKEMNDIKTIITDKEYVINGDIAGPYFPPLLGGKRKNHKRTQKKRKPKKTKKTRGKAMTFGKLMTFW